MSDRSLWLTFVEVLEDRARKLPDRTAFRFLSYSVSSPGLEETVQEESLSFAALAERVRSVAGHLSDWVKPEDRVLLVAPSGLDYVVAFMACLHSRVVAVTAHTPRFRGPLQERDLRRLAAIAADARPSLVLTNSATLAAAAGPLSHMGDLGKLPWRPIDQLPTVAWSPRPIDPNALAFLQYTSGSTSTPKGVMVSHANLIHNQLVMKRAYGHDEATRIVSWLPLFHDMGLIGQMLHSLFLGGENIFLSPESFVARPARWLEAISRYRGTSALAPNFGYELCLRKVGPPERQRLDLSSWRVAGNASEPVRPATMRRFARQFAPVGFRHESFYPSYGLAEATLILTGGPRSKRRWPRVTRVLAAELDQRRFVSAPPKTGAATRLLASSGPAPLDEIIVVDPETALPCAPGQAGEVWVRGPSVAMGYFNRPEETRATFQARRADNDAGPYLRTGDLGFLHRGHLYLAGRLKDLIILHGNNYYPQDLEQTLDTCHPWLRPGCGAAFSIDVGDEERLAVAYEVNQAAPDSDYNEVFLAIRQALARAHGLEVFAILLVAPKTIWKTTSGKIQRSLCRRDYLEGGPHILARWEARSQATPPPPPPPAPPRKPIIEEAVAQVVARSLGVPPAALDPELPLGDHGLDSSAAVLIATELSRALGVDLPATLVYDHPTLAELTRTLESIAPKTETAPPSFAVPSDPSAEADIAVVGLAGRFPGARNLAEFWDNLCSGKDSTGPIPHDRWTLGLPRDAANAGERREFVAGLLDDIAAFDASFFRVSPREARHLDPQQRLMLEVAWEALESACIPPDRLAGSDTGVFLGASQTEYLSRLLRTTEPFTGHAASGNYLALIANRISFLLGLNGPSLVVDTACSSSLVAVHLAIESLKRGECRLALAGGVQVLLEPRMFENFAAAGMLASDGITKTFDRAANGYVRGEGAGLVLLQRLADARADGNTIHAVLKGSAINQDGRSASLVAPSRQAQAQLLRRAYRECRVDPATVSTLEAHGTGTALGDPIELAAITDVFAPARRRQSLAIGSVKTNIGHLEAAAGVAGLIKVILSLRSGMLVPSLHFESPTDHVRFETSPLYVLDRTRPWPASDAAAPRRAGVSSFGFGGTNAHVVVEEAPMSTPVANTEAGPALLPLSARTESQLIELARRYAQFLDTSPDSLADVCSSASVGRQHFSHRLALIARSSAEAARELLRFATGDPATEVRTNSLPTKRTELEQLADRYLSGQPIDWESVYPRGRYRKVELPTYPFAREHFWFGEGAEEKTRKVGGAHPTDWFHTVAWEPRPEAPGRDLPVGPWLIRGDADGLADELATRLNAQGNEAVRVGRGDHPAAGELFSQVGSSPVVVQLFDGSVADELDSLFALFSAVARLDSGVRPRELWVVTTGAQAADEGSRPLDCWGAAAWGLARVAAAELPGLPVRLVDLDPGYSITQAATMLFEEFCLDPEIAEVAWRGAKPLYPWLVPADRLAAKAAPPIRSDGVYLVTGGLGALGSEVAEFLAAEGAKRLVLLGSTALPPESPRLAPVQRLRARGIVALPLVADVADAEALGRLLAEVRDRLGPLRGVFHLAGRIDDLPLGTKSLSSFRAVLAPKVAGMRNLIRLTESDPLDFFIAFSSVAPLLGTRGQADYAAANAYLDAALFNLNRARPLIAQSLAWSAWSERGMAARGGTDSALEKRGWQSIDAGLGRELLARSRETALPYLAIYRELSGSLASTAFIRRRERSPIAASSAKLALTWRQRLTRQLATALGLPRDQIDPGTNFLELGLDSILASQVTKELARQSGRELDATTLFAYPTIDALARHLESLEESTTSPAPLAVPGPPASRPADTDIAVIGLALRLPGADSPPEFWELLAAGRCAVGLPPPDRAGCLTPPSGSDEEGTERSWPGPAGYLPAIDQFDAPFFGLSGAEARLLDPQQRLFLEVAWEAIETAGYRPEELARVRAGVFAGVSNNEYIRHLDRAGVGHDPHLPTGNTPALVANRVSYLLGLTGPSLSIDTACSASLLAVHLACQSLLAGECAVALAGGVNLIVSGDHDRSLALAGMTAPDGLSKTFADDADGYGRGEGAAVVLLKPLAAALRAGDHVWSVIKGSATGHDGHAKVGLTAPSPAAQRELLQAAYARAGVDPDSIGMIEAHGTGTPLGDPIEFRALADFFARPGACARRALGSVKSNIGHLEAAAGIAGMVKAILALRHARYPATLHVEAPNHRIDCAASPFFLCDRLRPWPAPALSPRRAGVSSFGAGGANVHVILEEPPARPAPAEEDEIPRLFTLSARSEPSLRRLVDRYLDYLAQPEVASLADLCHTANRGRAAFEYRVAVVARSADQLCDRLRLLAADPPGALEGSLVFSGHSLVAAAERAGALDRIQKRLAPLPEVERARILSLCSGAFFEDQVAPLFPKAPATPGAVTGTKALAALAELFRAGVNIDWDRFHADQPGRRVPLPTYPFDRQRHWVDLPLAHPVRVIQPRRTTEPSRVAPGRNQARATLSELAARVLAIDPAMIDKGRTLLDLGLDSALAVRLAREIARLTGKPFAPNLVFEHPTIDKLASLLAADLPVADFSPQALPVPALPSEKRPPSAPIAVIGMGGRFPGAETLEDFAQNLFAGVDAVGEVPPERWSISAHFEPRRTERSGVYSKWGAFLEGIADFDPEFFHIAPREALAMDPQQRLALEVAWETLESAGYASNPPRGRTGVYLGVMASEYLHHLLAQPGQLDIHAATGNVASVIANRLSHHFGWEGPSIALDTACSSSLVAIGLALDSLRRGEIDLALAGGTQAGLGLAHYRLLCRLGALSPSGRCRVFDRAADGYVLGEGVGMVLLKRLDDAIRDGDDIRGVLVGAATGHGGTAAGLTVPSSAAQARVIRAALAAAGLKAGDIGYLEAHGTGTALGDPIEWEGLAAAFENAPRGGCAIGSVKSNIGHLEPAAGIAGLLKVLLALEARRLPPTLHLEEPNPHIAFAESPFYICDRTRPWTGPAPLRAGVSSFGFGGANAHLIVEEAPAAPPPPARPPRDAELLVLCARSETSLRTLAVRMADYLERRPDLDLGDVCHSLALGRVSFPCRTAFLARSLADAIARLRSLSHGIEPVATNDWPPKLREPAERYLVGATVDWSVLYPPNEFRRVRLPTTPFEHQRYWVPSPDANPAASTVVEDEASWFHAVSSRPIGASAPRPLPPGPVLLVGEEGPLLDRIERSLTEPGKVGSAHPTAAEAVRRATLAEAARMVEAEPALVLCVDSRRPWKVGSAHPTEENVGDASTVGWAPPTFPGPTDLLDFGRLIEAASGRERPPECWLVTQGAESAMAAALWSMARVARLEHPELTLRCLDLDPARTDADQLAADVLRELRSDAPLEVIERDGVRRQPGLESVASTASWSIKPDGVYLITGGLGALGLAVARELAARGHPKLVLLGRSELPPEAEWDEWATRNPEHAFTAKLAAARAISAAGADVLLATGDVAERESMRAVLASVRARFGKLDGVIHAAGVLSDSLLANLEPNALHAVLRPKLDGTLVLAELLAEDELDFFACFSSLAALVGNVGQGAYAAANAAMAALARDAFGEKTRVLTLHWGPWGTRGMAASPSAAARMRALDLEPIEPERGAALFRAALSQAPAELSLFRRGRPIPSFLPLAEFHAAPQPPLPPAAVTGPPAADSEAVVAETIAAVLRMGPDRLDRDRPFGELGLDSMLAEEAARQLADRTGLALLPVATLFAHPTVRSLAEWLGSASGENRPSAPVEFPDAATPSRHQDIAVIGYSCRFPGAPDAASYWELLRTGREVVAPIPDARWRLAQSLAPDVEQYFGSRRPVGGFLEDVTGFDPFFFRLSPTEANDTDPRQRLFLEVAHEAAEHAGYGGARLAGTRTGVFLGMGGSDYFARVPVTGLGEHAALGGTSAVAGSRLAYFLDLTGPNLPVDTACSSSLVALHLALQSLRAGECDTAFVGGVHLHLSLTAYVALERMGALSPTGHCRPFSAAADGFVPAEGVCVLLLKPLEAAIAAGDAIHGVIKGSAINNDGRSHGLSAPNPDAQTSVLLAAWRDAGIDPTTLGYLEAHGTGTPLGDPIEIAALTDAFHAASTKIEACRIGSVKGNLGHCDAAAGLAGLLKVLLAFRHGQLPPSLPGGEPNPRIDFTSAPLRPVSQLEIWPARTGDAASAQPPRRAGVSAFGFGGTNAHVVIEEPPPLAAKPPADDSSAKPTPRLFVCSARTPTALAALLARYRTMSPGVVDADVTALCHTAAVGRAHHRFRVAVLASTADEWRAGLETIAALGPTEGDAWSEMADERLIAWSDSESPVAPTTHLDKLARRRLAGLDTPVAEFLREAARGTVFQQDVLPLLAREGDAPPAARVANPAPVPAPYTAESLALIARLYVAGVEIDWPILYRDHPAPAYELPTYPFDRQPCWWDPAALSPAAADSANLLPWLSEPGWLPRPLALSNVHQQPTGSVLLAGDVSSGLAGRLKAHLAAAGSPLERGAPLEILFLAPDKRSDRSPTALIASLHALLLRALDGPGPVTVRVITQGAHAVRGVSDVVHPESAALWGFLKVAAIESPGIRFQAIDLDPLDGSVEAVARELLTEATEPEVAYRGGERFVPTSRPVSAAHAATSSVVKPGGTYLITGGSGGIGQALARWLTERHGCRVALVSRRPPDSPDSFAWFAADVRDRASLENAVTQIRRRIGPLDGVFHLAGAIRKGRLTSATEAEIDAILGPKVEGALNLDMILADEPAATLVLFSSVAGLRGNVFQADYSAASRFLDSFAAWRTAQGKRTISLDWGLWDEVGMGVAHALLLRDRDQPLIAPSDGLAALELALRLPGHHYLIEPPRTLSSAPAPSPTGTAGAREVEQELRASLGEVLGTAGTALSPRASFVDLGVDSILALKWVKLLEARLGMPLGATLPFDYPNLESLSNYLRAKIGSASPPKAPAPNGDRTSGLRLASGRQLLRYQPKG